MAGPAMELHLDIRKNLMLERTQERAEARSLDQMRGLLGR